VSTGPLRACPTRDTDKLRMLASLSNELADAVQDTEAEQRATRLGLLVERYGAATGLNERALAAAVESSAASMGRDADALGHGVSASAFLKRSRAWKGADVPPGMRLAAGAAGTPAASAERSAPVVPGAAARADGGASLIANTQQLISDPALGDEPGTAGSLEGPAPPGRRHAALAAGVQEITNTLVGDHSLNDVLRIILETMYRAIGFQRVLLFVLDGRMQALRCRFGFGPDADRIVQDGVAAPLNGPRDLFYAAVVMGADLCIDDLHSEKVRHHVPGWYRAAIGARGLVLLPIVNRKRTLGLIYADSDEPALLRFSAEELGLLKTLRNQALLAMRQLA
jgi:hypothetical protein